jgi:ADP-ribosyl-[dinitrogen reductase] hydrolase
MKGASSVLSIHWLRSENRSTFEDAVVRAANLGDDADTVAAVTGALAGAYYGYKAIPQRWTERLLGLEEVRQISTQLIEAA